MERILTGFLKCQVRTISMLSSSDQYDDTKVVRDAILRINLLLSLYQNKSIPTKKNVGLALSLGHEQAFSLIKPLKKASLLKEMKRSFCEECRIVKNSMPSTSKRIAQHWS